MLLDMPDCRSSWPSLFLSDRRARPSMPHQSRQAMHLRSQPTGCRFSHSACMCQIHGQQRHPTITSITPEKTSGTKIFLLTLTGLWVSFTLVYMIGIGLGTAIISNQAWSDANSNSIGDLLLVGYGGLAGFGRVCAVIVALGIIANSIPGTYSAALGCQVLGRYGRALPRWVWSCRHPCRARLRPCRTRPPVRRLSEFPRLDGVLGRDNDHHRAGGTTLLFRRKLGFDWARWEDASYLPIGHCRARLFFLLGWVGSILGMYQIWYTGPLAALAGGSDIGVWVGCGFALISFPPLRWLSLRNLRGSLGSQGLSPITDD